MNERALPRMGINISAGTTSALAGIAVLSNANGFSFGMSVSGSTASITASRGGGGLAFSAGTTLISSGQMVLSNSNGINFGVSGQTITAKPGGISFWDNYRDDVFAVDIGQLQSAAPFCFHNEVISRELTATRVDLVVEFSSNIASKYTVSIGMFTINGTSASLGSSTSLGVTWTNTNSSAQTGSQWRSVPTSFVLTPGLYLIGVGWSYSTNVQAGFVSVLGRSAIVNDGVVNIPPITDYFAGPYCFKTANSSISTMPNTIAVSQMSNGIDDGAGNITPAFAAAMRFVGTY